MSIKHPYKLGDRVICPSVDDVPGTVIEIGYNGSTKVQFDDGQIGILLADDLAPANETDCGGAR
jgi:hypothetical protein